MFRSESQRVLKNTMDNNHDNGTNFLLYMHTLAPLNYSTQDLKVKKYVFQSTVLKNFEK